MTRQAMRKLAAGALCLAGCVLAAEQPQRTPRLDQWRVVGPGGGGTMVHPTISPHDPRVVVEACDMTGAYITSNAGASWRMFNLGTVASAFAFDPRDPSVIWAAASALFRSDDAGRTWRLVFPDPGRNTVRRGVGDHADLVYTTDDPLYPSGQEASIPAITVDEADPSRVYIAMRSRAPGPPGSSTADTTAVLASGDGGRTWNRVASLPVEEVFAMWPGGATASPGLRVLTEAGVYEVAPGQARRLDAPAGIRFTSGSAGKTGAGDTILYATSPITRPGGSLHGGLHVSNDGGLTWRPSNGGLAELLSSGSVRGETWGPAESSRVQVGPISASARHGEVAYVGLRGLGSGQAGARPFNGVARTTDGGRTWTVAYRDSFGPPQYQGSWIEERGKDGGEDVWLDAPYDLGAAPTDPDVCYVTDLFRTYRTLDGGRTWSQVNSSRAGDGWTSRGLDVTTAYGVQWDPFRPSRVFIPYTDIGLFRSEDGGASWIGSSEGVPKAWRNTTYWLAFDPDVEGLMWGAFSGTHDLPRPKMFRRRDPATFQGGVAVSTDGGRHWTPSSAGMPEASVTHILLDPRSPKGRRTLYATAFGRGVFKSSDNGRTWALKNDGLADDPRQQPFAWRLAQDPDGVLYLVVARRSERGRLGDADDGAIYRSTDGADHWVRLPLPAGTNGPNGITIDPRDARRLYLSAWGVARPGGDTGGGIFVSSDAGLTWKPVLTEAQHVYDVTVDARHPDVLYACGFDQGVYRSTDRGETWQRTRGFNFKWGHRVVPDPGDASSIYVATFGGSVWHGPAAGDPGATEDVVPAVATMPGDRLARLVEANILGVHAYQVLLARRAGKGPAPCFDAPGISDAKLEELVAHQASLLRTDAGAVRAWAVGDASSFDPARDVGPLLESGLVLDERLPVNVFAADLGARRPAPRAHIRAVASLYQTVLEVERDGDVLQDLYRFYIALGLPVYLGQLGLPGTDADLLETGRRLEGRTCQAPLDLHAAAWQIAGRKIWNWGEKNLHVRDDRVLARELLAEPEVARLVPGIRAMKPQRIAVIGHSFTMALHWSSPSAFVPIAQAIVGTENPAVSFRLFQAGGLTSSRALARFYADVLAWKPDQVYLVVMNRKDEDFAALETMGKGFAAAGTKAYVFDSVLDPDVDAARVARQAEVARASGIGIVPVARVLEASPDRGRFLCLDGDHMTEPYHRLMAREWLAFLVSTGPGAR